MEYAILLFGICFSFLLFFIKHFVVDFPLQVRWMYTNKGTFGHPGGVVHAALHGLATICVLSLLSFLGLHGPRVAVDLPAVILWLSLSEILIHYCVDWGKMNINRVMGWRPDNSEWFWYTLGADQLLHYLTYLVIVFLWFC